MRDGGHLQALAPLDREQPSLRRQTMQHFVESRICDVGEEVRRPGQRYDSDALPLELR
ncbi:MAG: hypothetical protein HY332_23740 [Chloroflexi bacterium]|nr:hypothetical protein [Chloroflexota bacterium]